ncbi:MAG: patatin-like phospholipase family protein [Alphaproteobacteria bacterium]|nr:patatin-like phospholipase family protein [Alphaproteobacteria bacterium]MCB9974871.1 patatin-like phospholipase family protein [Rhodospirillales bacterium]
MSVTEFSPKNGQLGIGLTLGGGLARGFAHIGVLRTLNRNGIFPTLITGTSIGSVVGACYLADKLDEFEEWALSLNRYKIFSYLDFRVRSAGLIGGQKLRSLLEEHFKDMTFADLPHPLICIATDLATGHEVWLRKGNLLDAMIASFSLPGVFPPVKYEDRFLVDGALVNPCPVSPCQAMGARMTIAVDLNADLIGKATKPGTSYQTVTGFDLFNNEDVSPETQKSFSSSLSRRLFRREENNPSLFGVMVSALSILQDRLTRSRLAGEPPDVHIRPATGHIGLLEFEKGKELIRLGEEAAERAIPEIMAAKHLFLQH